MSEQKVTSKNMSIKEAAVYMDLTEYRVRRLIHEQRLNTELVPVKEGSKVNKHMIDVESIDVYQATKSRSSDGKVQYIIRLSESEAAELTADGYELRKRFVKKVKKA